MLKALKFKHGQVGKCKWGCADSHQESTNNSTDKSTDTPHTDTAHHTPHTKNLRQSLHAAVDATASSPDAPSCAAMSILNEESRSILYAELLSNIRQVSIAVTLPSPPKSDTVARITEDGRRLCLEHDGFTNTLDLPGTVAETLLRPSQGPSRHLTWRLPVSPGGVLILPFSPENQAVPWAALDLENDSAISCRACRNIIILPGTIKAWKDLPSENWAEMMEFWHCHKPHDHDQQENKILANKGYGANNIITAQPGVGFADITSFMFDERDCQNLLKVAKSASKASLWSGHRYNSRIVIVLPNPVPGQLPSKKPPL
ncbi:hypothetical protein C2857_002140 [Epichloe festucae Fl1]|uniref:Uncharacterized protein n=1 Tax=Epichloe festucae (strain Fl1) TaxID=877507 RepID=A0A7S9PV79_EPIFF|nr:hypothetical protein C2857_002140 [Epichloe festucae Fl1]